MSKTHFWGPNKCVIAPPEPRRVDANVEAKRETVRLLAETWLISDAETLCCHVPSMFRGGHLARQIFLNMVTILVVINCI